MPQQDGSTLLGWLSVTDEDDQSLSELVISQAIADILSKLFRLP